jgi:CubicO group peptidase (beta-lactamase class C family)
MSRGRWRTSATAWVCDVTGFAAALAQVGDWPVHRAGAAVVGPAGVLARFGDTGGAFELASVTKPLTALAVLVAVEEGALELSDPADEQLLPGATIEHLLAHASGLAPAGRLRSFAPGVRRVYSNTGFDLLGDLVAAATTMPFSAYFAESVVAPLRLESTSLDGSPARAGRASVDDLAVVVGALLAPGALTLLAAPTLADASRVHFPGLRGVLPGFGPQDPNDWGLGFEIRGTKQPHWTGASNSPATFGHFGQSGTMFWIDPVRSLGLIALADQPFGPWAAAAWPALADAVLAVDR